MKKKLFTLGLLVTGLAANAQNFLDEKFDNLNLGPIATDLTGAQPGQDGWGIYSAASTVNANDLSVVAHTDGNKVFALTGPAGPSASPSPTRYAFKGFDWTTKNASNFVAYSSATIYTGDGTSTSLNSHNVVLATTAGKFVCGFNYSAKTRVLRGLAYYDATSQGGAVNTYAFALGAQGAALTLNANDSINVAFTFDPVTGTVYWFGKGAGADFTWKIQSAAKGQTPVEIDFYASAGGTAQTPNAAAATVEFDNLVVNAQPCAYEMDATYQPITLDAAANQILCNGGKGSVTLTGTNTLGTYYFSNNLATAATAPVTISDLAAGTYPYFLIDQAGCVAVDTAIILAEPSAIAFTATPTQPLCNGEFGSVNLSATGGTGTLIYDPTVPTTDLLAGTYTYTVVDANLCQVTSTVTINAAPDLIAFTATPTQPLCYGEKGSVSLTTPTGGTGAINFDATATTDLAAGDYTYTATDANACKATATVTINAAPDSIGFIATPTQPLCYGEKGSVSLTTPTGGTGTINFDATATTDLAAGTYTYTATDANSCASEAVVTINAAPDLIAINANVTNQSVASPADGAVDVSVTGGTGAYTYSWSNQATTEDLTGVEAGSYTLTVTDANACTNDLVVTVGSTVSLKELASKNVSVYPNPSAGTFTITSENEATIEIINAIGESVYSANLKKGNNAINVEFLNAGAYILKTTNGKTVSASRIIINR